MGLLTPQLAVMLPFHTNKWVWAKNWHTFSVSQFSLLSYDAIIFLTQPNYYHKAKEELYLDQDEGKLVKKAPMEAGQLYNLEL